MRILFLTLALAAGPATADVFGFETPSGNIDCTVGLGANSVDIICEIFERSGPPALPRPASCREAWGHRFSMFERGPVTMECAPLGRNFNGGEQAHYGVTGTWGGISCTSETTGFQCRNADGHGFFLSKRQQTVF